MSKDVEFKLNPNFEKEMKKEIQKNFEQKCYIIAKRVRPLPSKKSRFEIVDAVNIDLKPGEIIEDMDDERFEKLEVFGGDPNVRKIRFRLKFEESTFVPGWSKS